MHGAATCDSLPSCHHRQQPPCLRFHCTPLSPPPLLGRRARAEELLAERERRCAQLEGSVADCDRVLAERRQADGEAASHAVRAAAEVDSKRQRQCEEAEARATVQARRAQDAEARVAHAEAKLGRLEAAQLVQVRELREAERQTRARLRRAEEALAQIERYGDEAGRGSFRLAGHAPPLEFGDAP